MIALKSLMLAGVTLVIWADLLPCAHAQIGTAALPPDVTGFIGRRARCLEESKKAFDPERKAQIDSIMTMMLSLRCGDIADDERSLREKYASTPEIVASLDATWVKVIQRLPVRNPATPDLNR